MSLSRFRTLGLWVFVNSTELWPPWTVSVGRASHTTDAASLRFLGRRLILLRRSRKYLAEILLWIVNFPRKRKNNHFPEV